MIKYNLYDNIVLDFDGVIVDSNHTKQRCIQFASEDICDLKKQDDFVSYFVQNNGVPREYKINIFFKEEDAIKVLSRYNECLKNTLYKIEPTKGVREFLDLLKFYKKNIHILSGGDGAEVSTLVDKFFQEELFSSIMCGPKTKEENLDEIRLSGKTLFIGDSLKDYEVANKYGFDFIFMYGYTQFEEWNEFFKDKNILMTIKDFSVLVNCRC